MNGLQSMIRHARGAGATVFIASIPPPKPSGSRALPIQCKPDHMNVESLGNVSPHLHWHVIPRYKRDGRWGQPIWAPDVRAQPERKLADDERARLMTALRAALA